MADIEAKARKKQQISLDEFTELFQLEKTEDISPREIGLIELLELSERIKKIFEDGHFTPGENLFLNRLNFHAVNSYFLVKALRDWLLLTLIKNLNFLNSRIKKEALIAVFESLLRGIDKEAVYIFDRQRIFPNGDPNRDQIPLSYDSLPMILPLLAGRISTVEDSKLWLKNYGLVNPYFSFYKNLSRLWPETAIQIENIPEDEGLSRDAIILIQGFEAGLEDLDVKILRDIF